MIIVEFERRTLLAFCQGPAKQLDAPLRHTAIASLVHQWLSDDYVYGWKCYLASLPIDVPWFRSDAEIYSTV